MCRLETPVGHCLGCGRSRDQIARWVSMTESEREHVWAVLPAKVAEMSIRIRLLPWTPREIAAWVGATMQDGQGTWVIGAPGALAEFPCRSGKEVSVEVSEDTVTVRAPDARFRLRLHDRLRAYSFGESSPIVLGIPRIRIRLATGSVMTALGEDQDAIDSEHRHELLFDFGTGRQCSRFCVRTSDEALRAALASVEGKPWSEALPRIGAQILAVSPVRVVESGLARMEIFSSIPRLGEASPPGAHTHFLPAILAAGDEIPATLALPDYAAPVAIFYPGSTPDNCEPA